MPSAVHIGERLRIEGAGAAAGEVAAGSRPLALVVAEDRYRVLAAGEHTLSEPDDAPEELLRRSSEERWAIGEVVLRRARPQLVLDLIVYDLDAVPMVELEGVTRALVALMDELARRKVVTVAMEAIGVAHGGISPAELAEALELASAAAPLGLHLLLCDADSAVVGEVLEHLERRLQPAADASGDGAAEAG